MTQPLSSVANLATMPSSMVACPRSCSLPGEPHEGWLTRVMRILFGWKPAVTVPTSKWCYSVEQPELGFSLAGSHHAQEYSWLP